VIKITANPWVNIGVAGGRRQGDGGSDLLDRLDLVLERRGIGRSTGERWPIRGSRVDGVQIIFRQETGAKLQVVIQVKRPSSLEAGTESRHSRGLCKLPHTLDTSKLALSILGSHLGSPTGTTPMVIVRVGHVGGSAMVRVLLVLVLLLVTVEERRHFVVWLWRNERNKK
jgi:hypothetical protein